MMKRLLVITLIFCGFLNLNAQEVILLNYNVLSKKFEKSEADIQNPKKNIKSATWYNRGKLLQDIYKLDLEFLTEGTRLNELKLYYKEPVSVTTGEEPGTKILNYERINYYMVNDALSRWERTKMVTENPLDKAYESFVKAAEIDTEGKMTDKLKEQLKVLKDNFKQNGINEYYGGNLAGALENFEKVLKIDKMDYFTGTTDTLMIQYSGIIARENGDYKKAAMYYTRLSEMKYGGPNTFLIVKNDFLALEDSAAAIEVMEKAFEVYPDTLNVVANLIDLYIKTGKIEQGLKKIGSAIEANPDKGEFYYWKGRLQLNMEEEEDRIDQALETYKIAIEKNQTLYYVYYDIGFIYFLQGQDIFNQAGLERDAKRRQDITDIATEKYNESIPMMTRALELNTDNKDIRKETLDVLKRIYYKLYGSEDERYLDVMKQIEESR